ncbi:MAG: PTS transporter subunit EIIC [Candidatus Malihini olakiniferum]
MPVIIVGAFSVLISNMVLDPKNSLASFSLFSFLAPLKSIMSGINYATLNFLTIGAVFLIGSNWGALTAHAACFPPCWRVICVISITPTTIYLVVNGQTVPVKDVLARQFSDTKSLFLVMFIVIFSVEIYSKLEKINRLRIKMPDSVPLTWPYRFRH